MVEKIKAMLDGRDVLLADGAMGTNLFALGLETGDAPEQWNRIHPERVRTVHRDFIEAGSDIILTNSFGGNRYRLALHNFQNDAVELNRLAAELARECADAVERPVLVAGSLGPTGEILAPVGPLSREDAILAFREQAEGLAAGGADLLWIETISSFEEMEAAVIGASDAGLPIVATMTFDTNGRTMMGLTPEDAVRQTMALSTPPLAFGANCGIGPPELLASILSLMDAAPVDGILVAKGNCGVPQYEDGAIVYKSTPEIMATYATMARNAGARIIGGCCGTTSTHLVAMRQALDTVPRGERPNIVDITEALGPITRPEASAEGSAERNARSKRRRRR